MPFTHIDFTTFADVPNPDSLPSEWPAESKGIVDVNAPASFVINHRLPITEYESYIDEHKPAYNARVIQLQLAEAAALAAQQLAEREAAKPDYVTIRDQAQAAIDANNTFMAIVGTPSNAQVLAQLRMLTQENTKIIKALRLLAADAI